MMGNKAQKVSWTNDGRRPEGGEILTCGQWGGIERFSEESETCFCLYFGMLTLTRV